MKTIWPPWDGGCVSISKKTRKHRKAAKQRLHILMKKKWVFSKLKIMVKKKKNRCGLIVCNKLSK